jgi:hypothetical protein
LRLPISETVAADHVTASVATVTGLVKGSIERVHLLTQAIAKVQDAAGAGGNRVLAMTVSFVASRGVECAKELCRSGAGRAGGRRHARPTIWRFSARNAAHEIHRPLKRKQIADSQGDDADSVLYVRAGALKARVLSPGGKEAGIAILRPESFFDEECLAGHKLRLSRSRLWTRALFFGRSKPMSFARFTTIESFPNCSCAFNGTQHSNAGECGRLPA